MHRKITSQQQSPITKSIRPKKGFAVLAKVASGNAVFLVLQRLRTETERALAN